MSLKICCKKYYGHIISLQYFPLFLEVATLVQAWTQLPSWSLKNRSQTYTLLFQKDLMAQGFQAIAQGNNDMFCI